MRAIMTQQISDISYLAQQYKITCMTEGRKTAAFYWTLKPKTFHIEANSCDFQQEARNQHVSADTIMKYNES